MMDHHDERRLSSAIHYHGCSKQTRLLAPPLSLPVVTWHACGLRICRPTRWTNKTVYIRSIHHIDAGKGKGKGKGKGFPILNSQCLARSWSRCTGSQPAGDRKSSIHPAVGCHYFPPGLQLPPQPQSITAVWPVPSYTAWWQRHIVLSNLPKVVTQRCLE